MTLKGNIIFSYRCNGNSDIWKLSLESGAVQKLTNNTDFNTNPRWSPDGSSILYLSTGSDGLTSLWMMDSHGHAPTRLTDTQHIQHPSWSPDGKKIIFSSNPKNSECIDICSYSLDSKLTEVLFTRPGIETEPSFSPDGKKIIFAAMDPHSTLPFSHRETNIWVKNLASGEEKKICSHPARDYCPVYSPDGLKIAFVSHRNGRSEEEMILELKEIQSDIVKKDMKSIDESISRLKILEMDSEICVVKSDGTDLRQLTENKGCDIEVRWSPCGYYLVYVSSKAGSQDRELKIISVDEGEEISFPMNMDPLVKEQGIEKNMILNTSWFWDLIPDFIEAPFKIRQLASIYWGEIHSPDWK
jgi:Tol biopolymer transport system component